MARGLYKRGSIWWIRYAGLDGREVRESSGASKFKMAQALLIGRKKAIGEGKQPEIKKIANHLFQELADEYLRWAEIQRGFRSKQGYMRQLLNHFGNIPLRRFNPRLVEQFQSERIKKGNKPATVNRLLATLKHMFSKAVDWDFVEEAVLKGIRRVKMLEENNKRLPMLSKEDCQRFVESSDGHIRPIIITALNTGMRKTEILQLTWDRIDFKHGFITLIDTKNGERRHVPMNKTLKQTLRGIVRRLDSPYVFLNPETGKPYSDVRRAFKSACKKAGLKDFRFHDLRHVAASHLVMAGADLTTVKELLGHKTLSMTLRYAHLAPAHQARAMGMLEKALGM